AAVVVEGSYSGLLRSEHAPPGWLADLLARLQARYPGVAVIFAESRPGGGSCGPLARSREVHPLRRLLRARDTIS
ncbi:MAG: hypothetical protein LC790_19475, partial [Actinobacteria bacterium]|nr:hypothetical protein [Actinomycetota bacterium]